MLALLSDIHGNMEALSVVFADMDRQGIEDIYCLGDVIGYGPEPRECLELVMERCKLCLIGNHEHGAMYYASDFNPKARAAIEWTKGQLNRQEVEGGAAAGAATAQEANYRLWNYIDSMPETHIVDSCFLAHGSPRDPVREYLLPGDALDEAKMKGCFAKMGDCRVAFVGHSHVPGFYQEGGRFYAPDELDGKFRLGDGRGIVNIGSVGQPRDGDTRTSYVSFDPSSGEGRFHRLEYDFEKTMEKIRMTELPSYLADRLAAGR